MLLGITFTLATYYSANLSQNIKRGHKRALKEGKSSGKAGEVFPNSSLTLGDETLLSDELRIMA
jgi:hypothetical protein